MGACVVWILRVGKGDRLLGDVKGERELGRRKSG